MCPLATLPKMDFEGESGRLAQTGGLIVVCCCCLPCPPTPGSVLMRKISEGLHLQATAIDVLAEGVHSNGRVVACHLGDYV